jgi:hypothetical protein
MEEEVIILEDMLGNTDLQDPLELIDGHPEQIDGLNQLLHDLWLEHQYILSILEQFINDFKYDVFHTWEVKCFY